MPTCAVHWDTDTFCPCLHTLGYFCSKCILDAPVVGCFHLFKYNSFFVSASKGRLHFQLLCLFLLANLNCAQHHMRQVQMWCAQHVCREPSSHFRGRVVFLSICLLGLSLILNRWYARLLNFYLLSEPIVPVSSPILCVTIETSDHLPHFSLFVFYYCWHNQSRVAVLVSRAQVLD